MAEIKMAKLTKESLSEFLIKLERPVEEERKLTFMCGLGAMHELNRIFSEQINQGDPQIFESEGVQGNHGFPGCESYFRDRHSEQS